MIAFNHRFWMFNICCSPRLTTFKWGITISLLPQQTLINSNLWLNLIWAVWWENLFVPYANNKGADLRLCCSLPRQYNTYTCYSQTFKPLPSFCGCPGWFQSYLVENPEDRFSRDEVHMSCLMAKPTKSESSLSAWRKLGSLATYWAHSEDWSDLVDAQADLSLCWALHSHFVGFVMRRLILCKDKANKMTCGPMED